MSDIKKETGKGLRKYRLLNEMTQKQLSEAIGMEESSYARVERGEKGMSMEKLIQVCKLLHISLDDIVSLDKYDRNEEDRERFYTDLCDKLKECSTEQLLIIDKLVDTIHQYI